MGGVCIEGRADGGEGIEREGHGRGGGPGEVKVDGRAGKSAGGVQQRAGQVEGDCEWETD